MTHADDELALWKRRALRAESAAFWTLWLHPAWNIGRGPHGGHSRPETAHALVERLHSHFEAVYPDLITRYEHQRIGVYQLADRCGCDRDEPDWEADHSEPSDTGEWLCDKTFLGYVCQTCRDDEDGGPDWKPEAVTWPCPPLVALNRAMTKDSS